MAEQRNWYLICYDIREPKLSISLIRNSGVVRDPNDDHVVAYALAASASHLVTRDPDLLTLKVYQDVQMITPEDFTRLLREEVPRS